MAGQPSLIMSSRFLMNRFDCTSNLFWSEPCGSFCTPFQVLPVLCRLCIHEMRSDPRTFRLIAHGFLRVVIATSPRPAKACFPPSMNLSFPFWNVAGETSCLRHNSATGVPAFKNSGTILAFSCGVRPLLMPSQRPSAPKNIRIRSVLL